MSHKRANFPAIPPGAPLHTGMYHATIAQVPIPPTPPMELAEREHHVPAAAAPLVLPRSGLHASIVHWPQNPPSHFLSANSPFPPTRLSVMTPTDAQCPTGKEKINYCE